MKYVVGTTMLEFEEEDIVMEKPTKPTMVSYFDPKTGWLKRREAIWYNVKNVNTERRGYVIETKCKFQRIPNNIPRDVRQGIKAEGFFRASLTSPEESWLHLMSRDIYRLSIPPEGDDIVFRRRKKALSLTFKDKEKAEEMRGWARDNEPVYAFLDGNGNLCVKSRSVVDEAKRENNKGKQKGKKGKKDG